MDSLAPTWTPDQITLLKQEYSLLSSFAEIAKLLGKDTKEVQAKADELGIRQNLAKTTTEAERVRLTINRFLLEHARYLPNGWLINLRLGTLMTRALVLQVLDGDTFLKEIEEETESLLEAIVQAFELTPVLSVGDMLLGEDQGQMYRITGREFIPSTKQLTYYYTYLYGSADIPEQWDDEDGEEDDPLDIRLHDN